MKANKYLSIIPILFFSSVLSGRLSAQENLMTGELLVKNSSTNDTIFVEIHPASMVFNGKEDENTPHMRYDLHAVNKELTLPFKYNFINGRNVSDTGFWVASGTEIMLNHDNDYTVNGTVASVGYGRYLIRISLFRSDTVFWFDTCTVEWDAAYPYYLPPPNNYWRQDLLLEYHANSNSRWITFIWQGGTRPYNIDYVGKKIVCWDQQYAQTEIGGVDSARRIRQKDFGAFVYDTAYSCPFNSFPQDSRADCGAENQRFIYNRSGNLTMNLMVNRDIYTRDTLIDFPTNITLEKRASLKIDANHTFDMIPPDLSCDSCYTNLIVSDSAFLILYDGASIIIHAPNKLTLKNLSNLTLALNSEIIFKPGSTFCNEGGRIYGKGSITFEKGIHSFPCDLESPMLIEDSCRILVSDSSELNDQYKFTLHLSAHQTALVLNPGSKLLFGENSGIVCDSGARIVANHATFASVDSTKKWNGISLNDLASDTIKNCTIKNAMYGIMISDRYDSEESPEPYSAEISGCSFVNQTSYLLNNAVYLQNSAHVLLKDNTVSATNLGIGFTHGIYAEYCPGEILNFIGNDISACNNGMTIIQSSPYIAFNTLNGNSYGESGMFLDNSNGTIKYNVISDFYNSYYSFYSSPDLLKNTFDNSCDDNVYLSSSSVPVMHPLVSGGSTYWFAGDNHITGSPYDAGILFDEDAYPDLNYGYNRFTLSGSNYYLSGINPSETSRDFYAVQNYWYDTPPDSSKFNVANAESVIYSPYDNNSTSARATNNLQLDTIGFGMYDTLHFYESDNPNSEQELFLLAYQSEFNGEYEEAIGYYKEIVSCYKDSSSTSTSLARIFNCYEKKEATLTEYALLENYFLVIAADTAHPVIMRNISEDLAIQSNLKQGNIEEAISDYNEIYSSNTNTPKGFHALINKEILSAGAGDNLSSGSTFVEIELKQIKINSLLKGLSSKDANAMMSINSIPYHFSLSQNYPNPFNPVTTINYDLPNYGVVTIKVYDMLGREVKTLVNEMQTAGYHKIQFNAADLSSGAYFYQMKAGDFVAVKKFVVLK